MSAGPLPAPRPCRDWPQQNGVSHAWTRLDRYSSGAHWRFLRGRTKHRAPDNCWNCRNRPSGRLCRLLLSCDRRNDQNLALTCRAGLREARRQTRLLAAARWKSATSTCPCHSETAQPSIRTLMPLMSVGESRSNVRLRTSLG